MRAVHFCGNHSIHGSYEHVLAILELAFLRQCLCFRLSATITHDFCLMFISINFGQILTSNRRLVEEISLLSTPDFHNSGWLLTIAFDYLKYFHISFDPDCVLSWLRALTTVILRQWCVHYGEHHGVPLPPLDNEIRVSIDHRYRPKVSIKDIDQRYLAKIWIIQGWLKKVA